MTLSVQGCTSVCKSIRQTLALAHHQMHPASAAVLLPCYHSNRFPPHLIGWAGLLLSDRADMSHVQRAEQLGGWLHFHTSLYASSHGSLSFLFWALNIQIQLFYFRIFHPTCLSHYISSDSCVILHILEVGSLGTSPFDLRKTMHCTYSATAQLKMHIYVKI